MEDSRNAKLMSPKPHKIPGIVQQNMDTAKPPTAYLFVLAHLKDPLGLLRV